RMRSQLRRSRSELLSLEAVGGPAVTDAIVQAIGASLPEFEFVDDDDVAAPKRRRRRVGPGELRFDLGDTIVERAGPDDAALRRRPRPDPVAARTARPIPLGLVARQLRNR